MNSYEERKQSSAMLSAIPLGQPIHVGHYSEKSDRNYRNRAAGKFEQGIKESDKAAYYAAKAQAAENNNAISSDDPEAVAKLEEKLKSLQEHQDEMKKANAYYRKNKTMKGYPDLSDEEAAKIDEKIKNDYSWNQQPFSSYKLTNNNGNIRRIKGRIDELKKKSEMPAEGRDFDGGYVEMNKEYNRIQIFFEVKPDENIRKELKLNGFRWAPSVKAWQRQLNSNGLYALKRIKCLQPTGTEV